MLYPPRPANISIPAVIAGNVLQNDDTSISAIDSGYDGTIVMRTQNNIAMIINPEQKTSINTDSTNAMLTVNNNLSSTATFRMSYRDSFYFDGRVTANGSVLFFPHCDDLQLDPQLITAFRKNFNIADHDGTSLGLMLGGRLITASASELNYVDVPAGIARGNKAAVLDGNLNFSGMNRLLANEVSGTLLTGDQPNITTLKSVNITDALFVRGEPFGLTPALLQYIQVQREGIAFPLKAVILDGNRNFTGINNFAAANITGVLTSGPQPNITSLSALTSLTNNGPTTLNSTLTINSGVDHLIMRSAATSSSSIGTNTVGDMTLRSSSHKILVSGQHSLQIAGHDGATAGLILGSELVVATATQLNYTKVVAGTATEGRAMVLDGSKSISGVNVINASVLSGTLNTRFQPNILSVNTLNIVRHDGSLTGLALNNVLVTSTANQLNSVNVPLGVAQANKALVLDSAKNISGINALVADELTGTLRTAIQPNITQVNTLRIMQHNGETGLNLGGTLITATGAQINRLDVDAGVATGGKAMIIDDARNIVNINNLTASGLFGTLQTGVQPNIRQVNVLNISNHNGSTGLSLNGTLVTSSAAQLNRVNVDAGVAAQGRALVLDSSFSIRGINVINANTLGGVLSNPHQPNIRILASINVIDHDGESGLSLNGTLVTSSAYELNYVQVRQGIAQPSKALVLDSTANIRNINSITANTINGVIGTEAQPYITSVSTLNIMNHNGANSGLALNGTLVVATANQLNSVATTPGLTAPLKALVVDQDRNVQGINRFTATSIFGTLSTPTQPNIRTVDTLNIDRHNGTTGLSLSGTLITASAQAINRIDGTAGVAAPDKALIADAQRNISNINALTASTIAGTMTTPNQPNITSVSRLNVASHDGGSVGLALNGRMITGTADQLNFNSVFPGTATANRSLVTDSFNSVGGINTISASRLVADQLQLRGVIANYNTGSVVIKTYSFTDLIGRMVDVQLLDNLAFTQFSPAGLSSGYSCEIVGYLNPQFSENYTFYATCNDRVRLWVNGELILHSWNKILTARTSSSIFLNANQWVPIYIQYQVDTGSIPTFLVEWASPSTTRGRIPSLRMAWDNNAPANSNKHFTQNDFTIYNTSTAGPSTAKFTVDAGGDLTIDASGNDISLGSTDNFNIPVHDGTGRGLYLGGVLVRPSAFELNYLKVNPGIALASHALVIDASKSINGLNSVSANSIACTNLTTESFTISTLSLSGPLNNYNAGSLLIRQITGPDVNGRVVDVNTITDINLNNYDPRGLNTNFSLDIIGFILPTFSENYRFFAVANDRVRIWVNNRLILNAWDSSSGLEHTSDPIFLPAGQWVPIYIQFQNIIGNSSLQVRWSSPSLVKSFIGSAFMAWDNTFGAPPRALSSSDRITIFSGASGLTSVQSGSIEVDGNGEMVLSAKSGTVSIAATNSLNIVSHNETSGLRLGGTLVRSTADELNYVSGVVPGTVLPLKAIVLDPTRSLSGLTTISSNNLIGTILTPAQPNITSFGTLSSTLNSSSDIILSSTNSLRFAANSTACLIQAGSSTSTNAASDLFIGNFNVDIATSFRKLMIKSSGFVGVQTSSPVRTLSINGEGAVFSMRLIHNSSNGTETAFCDLGADASSNFRVGSNVIIGSSGTATLSVSSSGIMRITPSGGSLQIGNTSNGTLPLELGSNSFSISTAVGYLNSDGSVGSAVSSATSYSLRTTASIIVNGTVCVTSDRRLKKDINSLSYENCRDFIMNSNPVAFKYINDGLGSRHVGLIAQDVAKSNFSNLVKIAPHEGLQKDIDADGYVSPADAAFNVAYEEIVPILMTTMKETIEENKMLKEQVHELSSKMKELQELVHSLMALRNP